MSTDAERRSRLLSLKLRALVRDHVGGADDPEATPEVFAPGALLESHGAAWVLVDGDPMHSLGAVLARALRRDLPLHVLVERNSGVIARRASLFDLDLQVWHVDDNSLLPAVPEPHLAQRDPDPAHLALAPVIESAGADVVIEHGVVTGEVRGLEMCRVVDDVAGGAARLEVGMGVHDRETFAMVHGDEAVDASLRRVIESVATHRREGADPHPFNRFGAERMLRWTATRDSGRVGFVELAPSEPPVQRTNVKDAVPCVATGRDVEGNVGCVVFVHGVVLDAVPFAVDAADRAGLSTVTVAMRRRDLVASHEAMAARSRVRVRFALLDD